jgi:hypothetical protein
MNRIKEVTGIHFLKQPYVIKHLIMAFLSLVAAISCIVFI